MSLNKSHLLRTGLLAVLVLPLSGCIYDTAIYVIEGRKHNISVSRDQNWFWEDTVNLSLIASRMPDCLESLRIEGVPRAAAVELYLPPQEYVEPIHIAEVNKAYYAISTASCRVQRFAGKPDDLGQHLGSFKELPDGRFDFVADKAAK
ncbi:MAG: hypothetical protein HXY26_11325 [Hydrogenophilaceae bacterium]|nr:hypothetical protein [Hydrogenophilaceae bacterium]